MATFPRVDRQDCLGVTNTASLPARRSFTRELRPGTDRGLGLGESPPYHRTSSDPSSRQKRYKIMSTKCTHIIDKNLDVFSGGKKVQWPSREEGGGR